MILFRRRLAALSLVLSISACGFSSKIDLQYSEVSECGHPIEVSVSEEFQTKFPSKDLLIPEFGADVLQILSSEGYGGIKVMPVDVTAIARGVEISNNVRASHTGCKNFGGIYFLGHDAEYCFPEHETLFYLSKTSFEECPDGPICSADEPDVFIEQLNKVSEYLGSRPRLSPVADQQRYTVHYLTRSDEYLNVTPAGLASHRNDSNSVQFLKVNLSVMRFGEEVLHIGQASLPITLQSKSDASERICSLFDVERSLGRVFDEILDIQPSL